MKAGACRKNGQGPAVTDMRVKRYDLSQDLPPLSQALPFAVRLHQTNAKS